MRRSLLFVPGAEPRKLERARAAGADTLLFDLEDAVAPDQKERAREHVAAALRAGGFHDHEPAVRTNAPETPYFHDDLEAVVAAGARALLIPKCESGEGLERVIARLRALEARLGVREDDGVRLLALVETARGVAQAASLAEAGSRLEALCFGHVDFCLDMGLTDTDPARGVVHHARCSLSIAAKACDLAPIDNVCLSVRDERAFREDAELGLRLGFEGKLCIHPSQVEIANEVYTPTPDQIEYALRVTRAWERAQAEGRGVFALDDKMVDAPVVVAQQRILERARLAGALPES